MVLSEFNDKTEDKILNILNSLQNEMNNVQKKERPKWIIDRLTEYFGKNLNPTVIELVAAQFFRLNSDVDMKIKPDWLDMEIFYRGQKFALDNVASLFYSALVAYYVSLTLGRTLETLIITGKSSTPFTSFQRYLKTNLAFIRFYKSDPWLQGTPAYKEVRKSNRLHTIVQKKLERMSPEEYAQSATIENFYCQNLNIEQRDFESGFPAPGLGQCLSNLINKKLQKNHKFFTQCDLVHIQFSLVGLCVTYPKYFGIHYATDNDFEAFLHTWRALGYLIGVEDRFNYCRGTLEEVRTRTRDLLEYWAKPHLRNVTPEWTHMTRCIVEGLNYFFPTTSYDIYILELARIMNVNMPRLYNSMSYSSWITYKIIRIYCDYGSKLMPSLCTFVNNRFLLYYERASNFDAEKLKKLEMKSKKTFEMYFKNARNEKSSQTFENHYRSYFIIVFIAIALAIFLLDFI